MNSSTLKLQKNLFFCLILMLGFVYIVFLLLSFTKIYSGFLMQPILIISYLKSQQSILPLIFSSSFIFHSVFGLFVSYLLYTFTAGFISWFFYFKKTLKTISGLKVVKTDKPYNLINSPHPLVFTAGFFRPQVFVSKTIFKKYSPKEVNSILFHEFQHQINYDPLKDLLISLVKNITPVFPKKDYLFNQYATLTEINCDYYALTKINDKIPLLSALYKIQLDLASSKNLYLNNFSSQAERIKILMGTKAFKIKNLFIYNFLALILFLSLSVVTFKSDYFQQCHHLILCLQNLVSTPTHQISSPNQSVNQTFTSTIDCELNQ